MNGQAVFEKLSKMSENERKCCDFWWIIDKSLINNFLDNVKMDYENEINDELWDKIESELSNDEISLMMEDAFQEVIDGDGFVDAWDFYSGAINNKLDGYVRKKAKENGVEIKWEF
jgi:hypothetical protein